MSYIERIQELNAQRTSKNWAKKQAKKAQDQQQIESFNNLSNIERIKISLLNINSPVMRECGFDLLNKIGPLASGFIADVCSSVVKYGRISEKQAFVIAKFADQQGIVETI